MVTLSGVMLQNLKRIDMLWRKIKVSGLVLVCLGYCLAVSTLPAVVLWWVLFNR